MKLRELVNNRNFDINADYKVYYGTWNDGGELFWSSRQNGKLTDDDLISAYDITYMTVDTDTSEIVIEVL